MRGRFEKMRMRWWLENHILLLIAEKPSHGYSVVMRLRNMGFKLPGLGNMGTIYRILNLLEMQGLVESRWEMSEQGPAKRIYRITPKGWLRLKNVMLNMKLLKKEIDDFIVRFEKLERFRKEEKNVVDKSLKSFGNEF